jgi:hypothetical protein
MKHYTCEFSLENFTYNETNYECNNKNHEHCCIEPCYAEYDQQFKKIYAEDRKSKASARKLVNDKIIKMYNMFQMAAENIETDLSFIDMKDSMSKEEWKNWQKRMEELQDPEAIS